MIRRYVDEALGPARYDKLDDGTASFVSVRKALRGPGRQGRSFRLLSRERAVMDGCCETC